MALVLALVSGIFGMLPVQATPSVVLSWAKSIGGTSYDDGYDVVLDGSRNVYTTGSFSGTVDFDPGAGEYELTSAGAYDIFISKFDTNGNFVWARSMGGTGSDDGYAIALDGSGNAYITGIFHDTADFDPGVGTYNLISAGQGDIFISKLDTNGNFVWAKSIGGETFDDIGLDIVLDGNGNVYSTGEFYDTADFDPGVGTYTLTSIGGDIFISKLDTDGNFVWAKDIGGAGSQTGTAIVVDGGGNVYSTGSFYGTADFDPGPGTYNLTSAEENIFISKLDTNGNFVWAKNMVGAFRGISDDIVLDGTGNVYSTGHFQDVVDFDPGAGTYNLASAGGYDIFISKLDADGNFVWAKSMEGGGSDRGSGIMSDGHGNVYSTGRFQDMVDFDPGGGVYNLNSAGLADIFISKLDMNGNFVWAKSMGGTLNESGDQIVLDGSGSVYIAGTFFGTADFDPNAGTANLTSAGLSDIFVSKLDSGTISLTGNAGVGGATLSYVDGTLKIVTADGSGNYSITVPYGWSGTVTPFLSGYTFIPASSSYITVQGDQTAQDYKVEQILNGGFNTYPTTKSKIPTSWKAINFSTTDGKNTSVKQEGTASIRITGTGVSKTLSQTLLLSGSSGDAFTFSYWVKGSAIPTAGVCRAQILFYNGATLNPTKKTVNCGNGTYTFKQKDLSFTAPGDYTKIIVRFTYSKASGRVWFDAVSLGR